jgi:dethiobiotin synthetase
MSQRLFITSTGTGIGKTFITAALARQARALGKSVAAYKPVISGFDPAKPEESDTGVLLHSLGLSLTPENIARISPWRFVMPLAASMAARLENRKLDFDELVAQGQKAMNGSEDTVLIEGVGGVMVPLDERHTVIDWIEVLEIQVMLVVGSYLGTISHTLTALSVLEQRAIPVFAVIVNESETGDVSLQATVEELSNWTRLPLIVVKRREDIGEDITDLRGLFS